VFCGAKILLSIIKAGLTFMIVFKGNSIVAAKRLVNIINFAGQCNGAY
jgi:hypothetical protein